MGGRGGVGEGRVGRVEQVGRMGGRTRKGGSRGGSRGGGAFVETGNAQVDRHAPDLDHRAGYQEKAGQEEGQPRGFARRERRRDARLIR